MNSDRLPLPELPPPEPDAADESPLGNGTESEKRSTLYRLVPALDELRTYSPAKLRADTLAGLTVAAVAVPQAMAYALVAGVPPELGLYTAIVMTVVGAVLASSRQLINGPTNAISIAVFSAVTPLAADDKLAAAVLLALMVGVIQTGITLVRLGDWTRYISHSVIVGFTVGAGLLIVLNQFDNLLGIPIPKREFDHFLGPFWAALGNLGAIHGGTAVVGVGTVALVLGLRRLKLQFHWYLLPELLLAVVIMAGLVGLLDMAGIDHKISRVGQIPAKLPGFEWPRIEFRLIRDLADSALAISLLGLLEAIAMAKAIASRTGQKLDLNQQCLSEGVANIAGGFFQCIPGSGSLTRSAINEQAGAVTQWAGVISAFAVGLIVLLFAPLARFVPSAALAGILILTAWKMVDKPQLLYHLRATKFDMAIVLITAISAVAISVEFCIIIGVIMSFALYVPRAARLQLNELVLTPERVIRERMPTDPPCGRYLIFDLEGELFFGAATNLEKHFATIEDRTQGSIRVVVLRLKRIRNPDAVCTGLLKEFLDRMETSGITVICCGIRRDMAKVLRRTGLATQLGPKRAFLETPAQYSSTLEAVRYAYDLLGDDLCSTCPRREDTGEKEPLYYMI